VYVGAAAAFPQALHLYLSVNTWLQIPEDYLNMKQCKAVVAVLRVLCVTELQLDYECLLIVVRNCIDKLTIS
jgi:hypothetical protein